MSKKLTQEEFVSRVKKINSKIQVIGNYTGANNKILCKCHCGKDWRVIPASITSGGSASCGKCKRQVTEIYVDEMFGNWKVLNVENNNSSKKYRVFCKCMSCGVKKDVYGINLLNKRTSQCISCATTEDNIKATFTQDEYEEKLTNLELPIKLKKGQVHKGVDIKLIHQCSCCNGDWSVAPSAVLSGQKMCFRCARSYGESTMAKVLKHVLLKEYPQTEWESDIGFVGFSGRVSHYDIYVPELNLVIECQSQYHDTEKQTTLDEAKKNFAIKKGYEYKSIDHRDFSLIEAIQIFFPEIEAIPQYVDLSVNSVLKWSLSKAQELLDEHMYYDEIAEEVGAPHSSIKDFIHEGKLTKPDGYFTRKCRRWSIEEAQSLLNEKKYTYKKIAEILGNGCTEKAIDACIQTKTLIRPDYRAKVKQTNQKKPVVRVGLNGEVKEEYSAITQIKNFYSKPASKACRGENGHRYKDYFWFFKKEWDSGDYKDFEFTHQSKQIKIPRI